VGQRTSTGTASVFPGPAPVLRASTWLSASRLGLVAMALLVGIGAGLGAVAFRELISFFTWLATGHLTFGQQGRVGSLHFPGVGIYFVLFVPILGALVYGPLIQRYAREARGHGVPEVMVAVAENGGRIRPAVTVVKALASAICIGTGGSVGREGPIVQIGSAIASTLGQLVRLSENRLRIIVACGAAGGIAATFNAPLTGLFFGFEIVLRTFSLDALFATSLAAVTGTVVSRAFFGSATFFAGAPHGLGLPNDWALLLVVVLGLIAGLIGLAFAKLLYFAEDVMDSLWHGRPEWARPAVGSIALGGLLLAVPELFGVGYPVMNKVLANHEVLWFMVVLMLGKIVAASITLAIGGSGGVFAPSLFTGAAAGTAFGEIARHLLGAVVGPPGMYGVVAMGAVFASAAQAPLTSIASVVEMTGNFGLMVPVMLANGIASAVSKQISYGSIYTTKLLRRGIDIERPRPTSVLQSLTVADVMQPSTTADRELSPIAAEKPGDAIEDDQVRAARWGKLLGKVTAVRTPQALFADETLEQALRQLVLYGGDGLPVVSHGGDRLHGWVTRGEILQTFADRVASTEEMERGAEAAEFGTDDPHATARAPSLPLSGYRILEAAITKDSAACGRKVREITWPEGAVVVAATSGGRFTAPSPELALDPGERVVLLTPNAGTGWEAGREGSVVAATAHEQPEAGGDRADDRGHHHPDHRPRTGHGMAPHLDDQPGKVASQDE
jgi:CIC family chloride channel protein